MSSKKRRDVWKPMPVVIEIGKTEYDVVAQPMRKYMEFEERLGELVSGLGFGGQPEAEDSENQGDEAEVEAGEVERKGLVEQGVEVVYEILKCVIPTLEMSDVLDAPEPQLEWALETCLKINGGRWAQALVNDFLGPLMPAIQATLANWLLGVVGEPAPQAPTGIGGPLQTT